MFPSETALKMISSGSVTLAAEKDGRLVYSCFGRGIGPALDGLEHHGQELRGAEIYDLIIGKAAASVFVLAGASAVYGDTMSEPAVELLSRYGIKCAWRVKPEQIINRLGTGLCPFEQAVLELDTPEECLPVIRELRQKLKNAGS